MGKKTNIKIFLFAIFIFAFLAMMPQFAHAANLYFSPSSGSYAVGSTFSVSVYVSSADQAINAASGIITFSQDKLEVTSFLKTSSIFSLWVQEPSFSNSAGIINFEGIVLNPGFTGSSGKIAVITFKVKDVGMAPLVFSSGSVLANDGKGTNILTSLGSAQFNLENVASTITPKIVSTKVLGTPSAPQISSLTHSDSNEWYAKNKVEFTWPLPSDVIASRLLYDKYPNSQPRVIYEPAITNKEISDLNDGIYYFHVQFKNSNGWGIISHFRFQIDTQLPELFEIKFIDGEKTENPRPVVAFGTTDALSGIDYYRIKIGEEEFVSVMPDIIAGDKFYTLSPQNPGKRSILVQSFDKAGNYNTAFGEFEILAINSPIINEYPKELQIGESLVIRGSTYPNSKLVIWLQKEKDKPENFTIKSNQDGKFTFIADKELNDGVYKIWAEVINEQNAKSEPSDELMIIVKRPAFLQMGTKAIGMLAVVVPLIALIILLLLIIWYGWYRIQFMKRRFQKEVREAEPVIHKAFDLLREDMSEQIKMLENIHTKRQLTEEEEKIIKQLKKNLNDIEELIRKELEDIKNEIK